LNYRAEIDGLRAIAVLAVIIYHTELKISGLSLLPGGFLGVDIFFVISGYLISKIIISEISENRSFNYLNFYERRARRILPVLFFIMIVSFPFAWHLLLPSAFVEYVKSILSSIFFGSNVFFYFATTEYGAESSLIKPFLHTWSLSLEEQFYLVFPIAAVFIHKYLKRYEIAIFACIAIFSFEFAIFIATKNPDLNFYLLPSRAWELLVGTLVAIIELKYGRNFHPLTHQLLPAIGFFLILHSLLFFTFEIPHPGLHTSLSVFGTALVLLFSSRHDLVGNVLSSRPFVSVGLISYSLYLWHYPIFAFTRIYSTDTSELQLISAILVTFFLSYISYRFIEQPFRTKSIISGRYILTVLPAAIVILTTSSYIVIQNDGDFGRFESSSTILSNYEADNNKLREERGRFIGGNNNNRKFDDGKIKVLIVGNSHGGDSFSAFIQNEKFATKLSFIHYPIQLSCFNYSNKETELFFSSKIYKDSGILFVSTQYHRDRKCTNSDRNLSSDLTGLEELIRRARGDEKILVLSSNTIEFPVVENKTILDQFITSTSFNSESLSSDFYEKIGRKYYVQRNKSRPSLGEINKDILSIASQNSLIFLDKEQYLCSNKSRMCFAFTEDGHKTIWDYAHFTVDGAKFFGKRMLDIGWLDPLYQKLNIEN
jgi:peptidoglycan/LPS O-acetylase OafA/YrhL